MMGKLAVFEVALSQAQGVYYAGQRVEGQCIVQLQQEMAIKCIRLRFEGKASIHWTEPPTGCDGGNWTEPANSKSPRTGTGDRTQHYYASENYFNHDIVVCGHGSKTSSKTCTLGAGHHAFPFSVHLPSSLPSSFEGDHGHVRYSIRAVIDKPWKFDHVSKRMFTVIGLLDLNQEISAQSPVEGQDESMICCLCCANGPITVNFHLQRCGYVPGEAILWSAQIQNQSRRRITKSVVDLKMVTTFYAKKKSRKEPNRGGRWIDRSYGQSCHESRTIHKDVGQVTHGIMNAGQSVVWENRELVIPPVPPSYLRGCKLIYVKYILKLTVYPSEPAYELEVPLEVIVGTIPLYQASMAQHSPHIGQIHHPPQAGYGVSKHPQPENRFAGPHPPSAPPAVDSVYGGVMAAGISPQRDSFALCDMPYAVPYTLPAELPPPTYSECMFGKVNVRDEDDDEHTRGNLHYAPVYAYYGQGHHHSMNPTPTKVHAKHTHGSVR